MSLATAAVLCASRTPAPRPNGLRAAPFFLFGRATARMMTF